MKKILIILAAWFVLLFLVNKISSNLIPDRTSYEISHELSVPGRFYILPWLNFDGRNYLDIADRGYFQKGEYNLKAFFPAYPLLIRVLSLNTLLNPVFVGLLISYLCFVFGIILFYRLILKKENKDVALKSVISLLVFPTSFFFLAYYTESLFFLFMILFFSFMHKKAFLKSAIFAALLSATRVVGIIFTPLLFCQAWKYYKEKNGRKFPISVLIAPSGFIIYFIYDWITGGNPFGIISAQSAWDRSLSIGSPIFAISNGLRKIVVGPQVYYDSPFVYPVIIFEFFVLILIVIFLVFSFNKIKKSYWLYSLWSLVLILFGGLLSALPRYALLIFPLHIYIAKYFSNKMYFVYIIISCLLMLVVSTLFLRGYWIG